jgi:hypothetical protein
LVHRRIVDAVEHAVALLLARHQPLLRHLRQVARDVGHAGLDLLGDLAHAELLGAQRVEDAQARGFGQRAEVMRHVLERGGGRSVSWDIGGQSGRGGSPGSLTLGRGVFAIALLRICMIAQIITQ